MFRFIRSVLLSFFLLHVYSFHYLCPYSCKPNRIFKLNSGFDNEIESLSPDRKIFKSFYLNNGGADMTIEKLRTHDDLNIMITQVIFF